MRARTVAFMPMLDNFTSCQTPGTDALCQPDAARTSVDLFARLDKFARNLGWSWPPMKPSRIAAFAIWAVLATPVAAQKIDAGRAAYEAGDYATALENFQPLAEQGNAVAQVTLGFMYDNGQACRRTTPRLGAGFDWQLSRAMPVRRSPLGSCMPTDRACRRISFWRICGSI